jgi:GDP-D-mannose dehydratase
MLPPGGSKLYVSYSFEDEFSTINTNLNGTHYVLSSIKRLVPECKFYFAGSSEMFGHVRETPQTEETPFHPRSPYGISKTVREFLEIAFKQVDLDYPDHLEVDENLYRPSEVNILQGDAFKAHRKLDWRPETGLEQMIAEMIKADLEWYSRV